jgi:hypothetical protein
MIKHHRITDQWKIELDGKTYWVTRCKSFGYKDTWEVENVRLVGGVYGGGEASHICDPDGKVSKRVVSWMKAQLGVE